MTISSRDNCRIMRSRYPKLKPPSSHHPCFIQLRLTPNLGKARIMLFREALDLCSGVQIFCHWPDLGSKRQADLDTSLVVVIPPRHPISPSRSLLYSQQTLYGPVRRWELDWLSAGEETCPRRICVVAKCSSYDRREERRDERQAGRRERERNGGKTSDLCRMTRRREAALAWSCPRSCLVWR